MSYILDALKKSEAEERPETAATMIFEQRASAEREGPPWVLIGIVGALLVNAGILIWLFGPWDKTPEGNNQVAQAPAVPAQTTEPKVQPRPRPRPQAQTVRPKPISKPKPIAKPSRVTQPEQPEPSVAQVRPRPQRQPDPVTKPPATTKPTVAAAPTSAKNTSTRSNVIAFAELPQADKEGFPELEFSTHIYAEDAELRAVVVNGKRLSEGDSLNELVLQQITEEGVVVKYRNYQVAVSVLEQWDDV